MGTKAPPSRPRGTAASRIGLACFLIALAVPSAHADYRTSRNLGWRPWEPTIVRQDDSYVSLFGRPPRGLLKGHERKIRQEVEIDLERGKISVRQLYGAVPVAPEFIQDLRTSTLAAASVASRDKWREIVRQRALQPPRTADQGLVSIEIPVEFPDALAGIIGQGARLNLTGSERITFSGTSNIIEGGPTFESGNPSAFPDLDMKQQLRVNLDGTIGEKIHVLVNHDSEVDTDFENKIKLRYDGDEDEVIQKIEMGNTDLSLPGSEFLSFRKSQQGLFGAKAEAKLGHLDLTVIASKQEGKTATQSFVGRAKRDSLVIRDTEYVKRKYYWIANPDSIAFQPFFPVSTFELFLDDKDTRNDIRDGAVLGFAYTDPATGDPEDDSGVHRGFYHRLTVNEDYQFDPETGALILERNLARNHALAVYYIRTLGPSSTLEVGSLATPDTLRLQILAPPERELYDDAKGFAETRKLEQKNVYFLGARNIRPDSFEMRILRKASAAGQQDEDIQIDPENAQPDVEFVRVLGLDYKGITDDDPDLIVEPEYVDFEDGTITFPNLTPFAPDSSAVNVIVSPAAISTGRSPGFPPGFPEKEGPPLLEYNSAIYDFEPDDLLNQDKYLLEVKYTTPTPSYSLNRFNILEGSEQVRLNGRVLSRGADYNIDYDFGVLTFRTPDASEADAEIQVDFEFVPLFGQAKESLVGLSGTYNFGTQTRLSSSWLFFTRATPEERPKLGQEPSRILVGNMYGQWISNPSFMTSLVNAIPLVRSEAESELQIQGEAALSIPNPNTKGEIYVDDMEGVEDSRELSITRGVWAPSSEPAGPDDLDKATGEERPLPYNWYNPENEVRRREVFPELEDEQEGGDFIQVLELAVRDEASVDSSDPNLPGWMGVMRNLSVVGEDFSEKKFLEIWVQDLVDGGDFADRRGRMIFDMGEINEDFYVRASADTTLEKGRGFLDTEDFNPRDGELTVGKEDFGLDNFDGTDGQNVFGDDGDDDFEFRRTENPDFSRINNYEGNSLLDTEDLDDDNFLDEDNAYLSYVLDLADDPFRTNALIAQDNSFWDSESNKLSSTRQNNSKWRLFRIPLDDGVAVGGVPRRRSIKYVRIWFDGLPEGSGPKVRVASIKIVGAAWLEEKISTNDTGEPVPEDEEAGSFLVNVINNKEDAGYTPPFDPGEDSNNEERREQSLVLTYEGIPSGKSEFNDRTNARSPGDPTELPSTGVGRQGTAFKEILDSGGGRNQDFTQYESMSFYFRDGSEDRSSSGTFFFRFGPDTTNFYEFSSRPPPNWREIFIPLDDLTNLKLDPPKKTVIVEGAEVEYRRKVVDGDTLAVYGAPSLARVRRLTVGVKGDDPTREEISGQIWVNEIRLRSVKKDIGYAARASGNARFGDLLTASGGVKRIDSEFRRIEGTRHGTNEYSWNVRGDLKLNKFFDGRGISLPVTGDYSYSETTPRLAPNSDIELVEDADKLAAASVTRRRSVSTRFSKTRPSRNPLVRFTVDNMNLSTTYSKTDSRTPFLDTETESQSGQGSYNLNPGQGKTIRLLKRFDLSYFPTVKLGMNGNLNVRRSADVRENAMGNRVLSPRDPVRTRSLEGNMGVQYDPIRSNSFDTQFSFNVRRDFDLDKKADLWESVKGGSRELRRDHSSRVSYRPGFVRWLRPVLSYDTNYKEDQSPAVQPPERDQLVQEGVIDSTTYLRRIENSSTRDISTSLNLGQLFKRRQQSGPPSRAGRPTGRSRTTPGGEGRGGGAAPAEDAKEDEPKKGSSLGRVYDGFAGFMGMFGEIRYTYRDTRSSRFSRVGSRPRLAYQFGFGDFDKARIIRGTGSNLIEDNTSATYSSKIDTSFQPGSFIFLDASYARSITRAARNDTRNKTFEVTFPDVSVNVDGLEKRGFLKRFAKSSSVNSSYRKQVSRRGTLPAPGNPDPLGTNWWDNEGTREDFSPLFSWNTNWNSGINTTLSMNRSNNSEESQFRGVVSRTETKNRTIRFDSRYTFSAPKGVSFFGKRLRFQSDLTLNLGFDRSETKTEESNIQESGVTTTTVRNHRKSLSIKPRATYNFSRKIQGSLDIGFSRDKDLIRERTEKTISVALEALIKF